MSKMVSGKYKNIKDEIRHQEERWIQTIKNDAEELLSKVDQTEAEHTKLFDHEVQKFDKCLEKSILENQKLTELRKSQNSNLILSHQSNVENLRLSCQKSRNPLVSNIFFLALGPFSLLYFFVLDLSPPLGDFSFLGRHFCQTRSWNSLYGTPASPFHALTFAN